jgi:hypothetical protein
MTSDPVDALMTFPATGNLTKSENSRANRALGRRGSRRPGDRSGVEQVKPGFWCPICHSIGPQPKPNVLPPFCSDRGRPLWLVLTG